MVTKIFWKTESGLIATRYIKYKRGHYSNNLPKPEWENAKIRMMNDQTSDFSGVSVSNICRFAYHQN